jgi:hypothetical protein
MISAATSLPAPAKSTSSRASTAAMAAVTEEKKEGLLTVRTLAKIKWR